MFGKEKDFFPFARYPTHSARFPSSFATDCIKCFQFLWLTCVIKCLYSMAYPVSLSIITYE